MVPEELKKWVSLIKDVTSTSAIILIVLYLVWSNTGDRNQIMMQAKVSAEESVAVGRTNKLLLEGLGKIVAEDSALNRMILIQICINTANGDRQIINQCANYR